MLKHGVTLLLLLLPVTVAAQRLDDPQRFDRRLATCNGCHGREGIPGNLLRPVIWGQTAKYIDARIGDFRKGLGSDEEMRTLLSDLGRSDIVKISDYYAQKPWPDLGQLPAPPEIAHKAEQLIARGECTASGCHESQFVGGDVRVAGQSKEYLKNTLAAYRNKTRLNFLMQPPTEPLTDEDIEVLATFIAGLKP